MSSNVRRRTLRHPFVGEMFSEPLGKKNTSGWGVIRSLWGNLFNHKTTLDSLKNDYPLWRSLYHGTNYGDVDVDESIYLGSGFAKPIVNSTMAFAIGQNFTVKIAGSDEDGQLELIEQDLEAFKDKHFGMIYDWLKFGTRDGDGFLYIDEQGRPSQIKPETVDVVVDAITGRVIGFNVTDNIELTDPVNGAKTKVIYLKQYRENYIKVIKMVDGQNMDKGEIVFQRIFANGEDIDPAETDADDVPLSANITEEDLDTRLLPIVHYRNEPEPGSLYGNSELQNIISFIREYGETLGEAGRRERYNGKPVLAVFGATDPTKDAKNAGSTEINAEGEKVLQWDQNAALYFDDPQANAKFLEIPNGMDGTGKLLEYLFYNIVQASETPEFVFGTAVSSSKASVSEQTPIVAQKAERKRAQMSNALTQLLKLYISRQIELSNPIYFPLDGVDPEITIEFPDIIDEDKTLTKETIEMLLTEGAISRAQAIKLSAVGDKIEDADAAANEGLADLVLRNDANNVMPEQGDRLDDELNDDDTIVPAGDALDDIEDE